jgi:hypothetical protein
VETKTRRSHAKQEDLLLKVARQIGSTLGAVAAKVSPDPKPVVRLKRRVSHARRKKNRSRTAPRKKKNSQ